MYDFRIMCLYSHVHTSVYVVDLCVCIYLYMWREINVSPPATHICKERSIDLTYPSHTHR